MIKNKYCKPNVELIAFETEDILMNSPGDNFGFDIFWEGESTANDINWSQNWD